MAQTDRTLGLLGNTAFKAPCLVATTANITLSGLQTIDGVVLVTGDRVLVKDQTAGVGNGIWVADSGLWSRAKDFDGTYDVVRGSTLFVIEGSANASQYWRLATSGTITIGTTSLSFERALVNDSSTITFLQSGTGAIADTAEKKLQQIPDFLDWIPVAMRAAVIAGTSTDDVTTYMQAALDAGHVEITWSDGLYNVTAIEIKTASSVKKIHTKGWPILKVTTASNRIGLLVSKQQYVHIGDFQLLSTGTKADGNTCTGLKYAAGTSFMKLGTVKASGFSGDGIEVPQCVDLEIDRFFPSSCTYGLSLEKSGGNPCSVVKVHMFYGSGCTRNINSDGTVLLSIDSCVNELGGDAVSTDGALHLVGTSAVIKNPYFESNARNMVLDDSRVLFVGTPFEGAGTAADVISYTGVAGADRGIAWLHNNKLNIRTIGADDRAGIDLTIGENLVVPEAGGSVKFGQTTTEKIVGSAVSATWTTVKVLVAQSGDGAAQISYRYAIYAGRADATTGFDSGAIAGGVIYSDTGTTPAWLRINSGNLQVFITGSSYGLDYGLTLLQTGPIGT